MTKFIITSSRPVLTDEERAKRMEIIKKAAIDLLIATERAKKEKQKNKLSDSTTKHQAEEI